MAASLHGKKVMKEERYAAYSNGCRDLIEPNKIQRNPSLSYFVSITITQPKIRFKIPKMLVKSMQRRSKDNKSTEANDQKKEMKKQVKPRKMRVGRVLFDVFGRRKTPETCASDDENGGKNGNCFDLGNDKEDRIEMGSVQSRKKSRKKYANDADKQSLGSEEEKGKKKRPEEPSNNGYKKGQLSFKSFFNKKNGLTWFRGKISKGDNTSIVTANTGTNKGGTTAIVSGRQESSHQLPRVPSRIMTTRQNLKMARSMRKKPIINRCESGKYGEQEDGERVVKADKELCKKRILMGEKCKPLNHSGTLQYDEEGVLLPEIIP